MKIDEESIQGPVPNVLDLVQRGTSKHKHHGATRVKQVPGDIFWRKHSVDAINEPWVHGDGTVTVQPELGEVWEAGVVGGKVDFKEVNRIQQGRMFFKDHSWSFEEMIGLMHREEKGDMWAWEVNEWIWLTTS